VEGEYMMAEEYDAFLFDPSDFMVRKYWPRIMGKLKIFEQLPPLNQIISFYMGVNVGFMAFGFPEAAEAFQALAKAGQSTLAALGAGMAQAQRLGETGFPLYFAACTQAPFDTLGDYFRGTKGVMIDMYRRPDKVVQACEKLLPIMLDYAVTAARISGNPRVLIPLHKGAESFMSLDQYRKFYWPTLKELMVGLINQGLVPVAMVQGGYTSRLDIIKDIPEGKACYWLESADLEKVGETLGGRVCIKGLLPMSLLVAGSVDDVKSYCRKLIDTLAKDGGYIMGPAAGSLEDAKPENVRAMFEFTREYGIY
jgi:uroporphyrinogen-III decarboxylase